jgi:MFS family permease
MLHIGSNSPDRSSKHGCTYQYLVSSGERGPQLVAIGGTIIFGFLNFLFAIPAIKLIDKRGRRALLLATFPLMTLFMLITSVSYLINDKTARSALVMLAIYLFTIAYSPGEGPVPFTYSAECYPLYVRDLGMSFATTVNWWFHFVVVASKPKMEEKMCNEGVFGFYAAMNAAGFLLILLLVPETGGQSLEELDRVFSAPALEYARYGLKQGSYYVRRYMFFQSDAVKPKVPGPVQRDTGIPLGGGGVSISRISSFAPSSTNSST